MNAQPLIRPMTVADLDGVLRIEQAVFTTPWSRESFKQDLKRDDGIAMVLVENDRIMGYITGWHVLDEIHIGNLAVDTQFRNRGYAKRLIRKIMEVRAPVLCIWLEVRESNRAARQLYQSLGFEEVTLRRGYYSDDGENAIVMMYRQDQSAGQTSPESGKRVIGGIYT